MKKIKLLFAWYDIWIGVYWDKKSKRLYILPIPMFGIVISFTKFVEGEIVGVNAYAKGFFDSEIHHHQPITKVWVGRNGEVFYDTPHCNTLRSKQLTKVY